MIIDTMAVLAYLLGDDAGHNKKIILDVPLSQISQATNTNPAIYWKNIPPEAASLALVIKEITIFQKPIYYWVVYNLPVDSTGFQAGQSNQTSKNNIGLNSWGQKNYHRLIYPAQNDLALIEIYALDKKFSTIKNITGAQLERKMNGHVLASGTYQLSFGGN